MNSNSCFVSSLDDLNQNLFCKTLYNKKTKGFYTTPSYFPVSVSDSKIVDHGSLLYRGLKNYTNPSKEVYFPSIESPSI